MADVENIQKISDYFSQLAGQKPHIRDMLSFFERKNIHWIVVGGAIRYCLKNTRTRDIDIVLQGCSDSDFSAYLCEKKIPFERNSFDGFKFIIDRKQFDVWTINNHYLFKKNIYEASVNNIQDTTFISYDSLVYDGLTKNLFIDNYMKCQREKMLDFVGSKLAIKNNPASEVSICKIYKLIINEKYGISSDVKKFIGSYIHSCKTPSNCINKLVVAYKRHYKKDMSRTFKEKLSRKINHQYLEFLQPCLKFE